MKDKKKTEERILRQQLELLAERSESATEEELPGISAAMCDIYKLVACRLILSALGTLLTVMLANLFMCIIVHVKKLLRGKA